MDNLASTVSMVAKNIRDEDDARIARYYEELSRQNQQLQQSN